MRRPLRGAVSFYVISNLELMLHYRIQSRTYACRAVASPACVGLTVQGITLGSIAIDLVDAVGHLLPKGVSAAE